jgi:hypothetical protein
LEYGFEITDADYFVEWLYIWCVDSGV